MTAGGNSSRGRGDSAGASTMIEAGKGGEGQR